MSAVHGIRAAQLGTGRATVRPSEWLDRFAVSRQRFGYWLPCSATAAAIAFFSTRNLKTPAVQRMATVTVVGRQITRDSGAIPLSKDLGAVPLSSAHHEAELAQAAPLAAWERAETPLAEPARALARMLPQAARRVRRAGRPA